MNLKVGQAGTYKGTYTLSHIYIFAHDTMRDTYSGWLCDNVGLVKLDNLTTMQLVDYVDCSFADLPQKLVDQLADECIISSSYHSRYGTVSKFVTQNYIMKNGTLHINAGVELVTPKPAPKCNHVRGKTPLTNSKNQLCIICKICGEDLEVIK